MKHIAFTFLFVIFAFAKAYSVEQCSDSSKALYQDILIYQATEAFRPTKGFVGDRLQKDLDLLRFSELSLKDKVHSLEAGYAKCYVDLTFDEDERIQMQIESFKKLNAPFVSDL